MKNYYIRTKFTYLFNCILYIAVAVELPMDHFIYGKGMVFWIMLQVIYLVLLFWCICETLTARGKIKSIISNGRLTSGRVIKILRVTRMITYSKSRGSEEARGYRIVAEAENQFGVKQEYVSDLIPRSAVNRIPNIVKIYVYGQENCFVWEKSSEKMNYFIDTEREVVHESLPRKWLTFLNRLSIGLGVGYIIVLFIKISERMG